MDRDSGPIGAACAPGKIVLQKASAAVAYEGIAKVQHYVPQLLLRNFGVGKKRHVHAFDKTTERVFLTATRNVAAESGFYNFEFEGVTLTLEPSLSQLEGKVKPLLHNVLSADSLGVLSDSDRSRLSLFFAVQLMRTRWFKETWRALPALLGEHLRRDTGGDEDRLQAVEDYIRVPDDNETTRQVARFIVNAQHHFAPHFANKDWVLLETDRACPFLIGDNPLAMQNCMNSGGFYGNIGLAVRGIEIYLPLSPTRALAMWCPSHRELYKKTADHLRGSAELARELAAMVADKAPIVEETLRAIEDGTPLRYRSETVRNFNSLQIIYAERYLFSSVDDFALAREMIAMNPSARTGPRSRVD